jgi:hypothetical protein
VKYLRKFNDSYDYVVESISRENFFSDDDNLDRILEDISSIFVEILDIDENVIDYNTSYRTRGFIEASIYYTLLSPSPENTSDGSRWNALTSCDTLDKQIKWRREITEILEEISTGVKRLKDSYPNLKIEASDWVSNNWVRIRITDD